MPVHRGACASQAAGAALHRHAQGRGDAARGAVPARGSSTTSRRSPHDPASLEVAAETGLPVVLMHAQGDPRTMQVDPRYDDVVLDVYDWLDARIEACERAGIPRARLIVDPGIGFGKTLAHNLALLGALSIFHGLGCAILLGASRKSFIGELTRSRRTTACRARIAAALLGAAQGRADPAGPRRCGHPPGPGGVGSVRGTG